MTNLLRDLRYALRSLRARPSFTLAALLALGLGIGANTAIFTVVEAVLLRPLPYTEPGQLVMVWNDNRNQGWPEDLTSYPDFRDWRERSESLAELAAFTPRNLTLTGEGEPLRVPAAAVSGSFFGLLGVEPLLGRSLRAEDDRAEAAEVAVLSHGLFERRFGGERGVIGRTLELDGRPYTVVGVMPPAFRFPAGVKDFSRRVDLWVPLAVEGRMAEVRGALWLWAVGRLHRGVSPETAQIEMGQIAANLESEYPDSNRGFGANVVGLQSHLVGKVRRGLLLMMGAVGLVLMIVVANVAHLQLARASEREREIAVRSVLGAGRARIARQLLTESLVLALLGSVVGIGVAFLSLRLILALKPPELLLDGLTLSTPALLFTLAIALLAGLVFGLAPALQLLRLRFAETLKEGGRTGAGGLRSSRLRGLLVVAEIALALVLLVGCGLLVRSMIRLQEAELGFAKEDLLTLELSLPRSGYDGAGAVHGFFARLLTELRALPGVDAASASTSILLNEFPSSTTVSVEGRPRPPDERQVEVTVDAVFPGYFATLGVPILAGRDFDERDDRGAGAVVIVNRTMAEMHWPGEDPVGRRMTYGEPEGEESWITVVGVVADTLRNGVDREVRPESYLPHAQYSVRTLMIALRTSIEPLSLAEGLRTRVWSLDPDLPVAEIGTLAAALAERVAQRRFALQLFGLFSGLALVLALVGIYGVLAYAVSLSRHELGVRLALGAGRGRVVAHVLGRGLGLAAIGIALGLPVAFLLSRTLAGLLYGVSPADPLTYAALPVLLAVVAGLASLVPALAASRVEPVVALRHD